MSELTPEEKLTIATYDRQAENWSSGHGTAYFWGKNGALSLHRFNDTHFVAWKDGDTPGETPYTYRVDRVVEFK